MVLEHNAEELQEIQNRIMQGVAAKCRRITGNSE